MTVLATREEPQALLRIEEASRILAECVRVDEAKDVRDKAQAIACYYRERGASLEVQNQAAEVRLRAERRLGELLRGMEKNQGGRPAETPVSAAEVPTLAEIGITHRQSSVWQRIAELADEEFEERVAEAKENGLELTTSRVLRSRPPPVMQSPAPGGGPLDLAIQRVLRAYDAGDHLGLRQALEDALRALPSDGGAR